MTPEAWITAGAALLGGVVTLALAGHRSILGRFDKLERRIEALCAEVKEVRERLARLEGGK